MAQKSEAKAKTCLSVPRLTVPIILTSDKTPTPTRLLRAVDEIGLFQHDEETTAEMVESAKSNVSNNPFDVHFRKATLLQTNNAVLPDNNEEFLNTPQILLGDLSAPPSASIFPSQKVSDNKITYRTIAPNNVVCFSHDAAPNAAAHLLAGETKLKSKRKKTLFDPEEEQRWELLERNRAAAKRSRAKRKEQGVRMKTEQNRLANLNKSLTCENERLRDEVARLKGLLELHQDCGLQAGCSDVEQRKPAATATKVNVVSIDPKDILAKQREMKQNVMEYRDILKEATIYILPENDEPAASKDEMMVVQNPSFVRVTPHSISVKPTSTNSDRVVIDKLSITLDKEKH